MISGRVTTRLEAIVPITLLGQGRQLEIEAIVDTGFNGELTLREQHVRTLDAKWLCREEGELADGSTTVFDVYVVSVSWNGKERRVEADLCESPPLIGMALMRGAELRMHVEANGDVSIT